MVLLVSMSAWDAQTLHRYTGYTVAIGGVFNVLLGLHVKGMYDHSKTPPSGLRYLHRAVGYTVISSSTLQSALGVYNLSTLWRKGNLFKKLLHASLGLAATGLYVYGGYLALEGNHTRHRDLMFGASALSAGAALVWLLPWR